ncbi:MAG TPA: hypothetical protein VFN41_10495 [Candidatus Limnocylindrales bacterium]|nr:hypothetical protein [Candidatus Limnocylindrales bacterium]
MDDLRRRFATLDGVRAPDLWDTIGARAADLGPVATVTPVSEPVLRSRRSPGRPLIVLLAAAALLVALVAGALVMGSGLVKRPAVVPPEVSASLGPIVTPTATPSANPTASAAAQGPVRLVAYTVSEPIKDCQEPERSICNVDRLWTVNPDGTGAHRLPQDSVRGVLGWTSDGSRIMYSDNGNLAMTDATGSTTAIVPSRPWCPAGAKRIDCQITFVEGGAVSSTTLVPDQTLCPAQVRDDNCQANIEEGVAVAPDGSRIGYVLSEGRELDISTVVTFDLSSGRVTRLQSTRSGGPFQCRTSASEGVNGRPTWAPDGTKLAFERQVIGPLRNGACQATVFVVDADGGNLVQLVPERMVALSPSWSPDGTRIAFHSATPRPGYPSDERALTADIYTIRPDGHDLQQLTDDGTSIFPRWTSDGRVVYRHLRSMSDRIETAATWVMDADGGNKTRIAADDIRALTEAGCTVCPYGPASGDAYWQPQP